MRRATTSLLLVQLAVGYEWLVSGMTKVARGDFPGGLAAQLSHMSKAAPGWYASFLRGAAEPHAAVLGYLIEATEITVGLVLAGAAVALLTGTGAPRVLELATGIACVAGIVMSVNFELASNGDFGLSLASNSFDGGVDLDTIMIALQLALIVVVAAALPNRKGLHLLH